jgi:hypothetical protein
MTVIMTSDAENTDAKEYINKKACICSRHMHRDEYHWTANIQVSPKHFLALTTVVTNFTDRKHNITVGQISKDAVV